MRFRSWPALWATLFALAGAAQAAPSGSVVQTGTLSVQIPTGTAGVAPFMRTGDPFLFPATTTAQQYQVVQPANTTSYRLVVPCAVDIRIKSVTSMSTPVTSTTGTRFLARNVETVASTANPIGPAAADRIISVMTVSDPGPTGCTVELTYGNGG